MSPLIQHALPTRRMLPIWGASLLMVFMATASAAPPAKKAPRAKKPAPPALAPPEMDRNSSRFILPDNQPEYLEKIRSRLSMSKRVTDPFGRNQDPDAAPAVVPTPGKGGPKGGDKAPKGKVTLEQALANLKITTVMPGQGRFLANGRQFQKGESIPFKSRGKNITVQVMDVKAAEITFRNAETGEVAVIKIKFLPPGMQPGTTLSEAPGLFRAKKDDPINLDAPSHP